MVEGRSIPLDPPTSSLYILDTYSKLGVDSPLMTFVVTPFHPIETTASRALYTELIWHWRFLRFPSRGHAKYPVDALMSLSYERTTICSHCQYHLRFFRLNSGVLLSAAGQLWRVAELPTPNH